MKALVAPGQGAPRLRWALRRLAGRLGWLGLAGLAGGAALAAMAWQAQQAGVRQQELRAQLALVRGAAGQPSPADPVDAGPAGLARQIAAFYAYLPAHAQIPEQLKELVRAAERNRVALDKGDYKAQPEERAAFLRYQITLPVKASYPNVQSFIVQALHDLPALTLESVSFKRERFDAPEVEASIHFVLLVNKAKAEGGR